MTQAGAGKGLPSTIGRYQILRELGRGAMGVVYEAHDPSLAREIALKVIQPFAFADESARETFEQRFLSEAQIAGRLSHPGIVVVHDVGRDPESGALYIALERLRGYTLAVITDAGRPHPWREAIRLTASVARALDHAHAQGVVHRDMKPANVMVLESGETKIMDFGVATLEAARIRLTAPGDFVGTPLYMAPEQAKGEAVDRRTDIFSLGAITYTLLTGRPPFEGANMAQVVARAVGENPPPPSSLVPGIPREVDRVVARAMVKAPAGRYPDAGAMASDLQAILEPRRPRADEVELVVAEEDPSAPFFSDVPPAANLAATKPPARPTAPGRRQPRGLATEPARPVASSRAAVSAVLLLLALGLSLAVAWWRERVQAPPAAAPSAEPTAPSAEPTAPPREPPPIAAEPTAPPREPSPVVAEPSAFPSAPFAPTPASAPPPAHGAMGLLAVDLEHPLQSGTLKIWVDTELVLDEKLSGRVSKNAVVFKLRKGTFNDVLELSPGKHRIRVQVQWEQNLKTEEIGGTFAPGLTRRLEVRVGRLRKNLSLEWK